MGPRAWVEGVAGARVTSITAMPGATSSEVTAITTEKGQSFVLRRFTNAEWLAREPDVAEHEAAVLELLRGSGIPAPELVAVDIDGSRCGVPAVLATRLAGRTIPDADPRRLAAAAERVAAIHDLTPLPAWRFARYNPEPGPPPPWSLRPAVWEAGFAAAGAAAPPGPAHFVHRDYHYGNVLWADGRLTGIVDWVNACAGPPGIDVARYRLNLALDFGPAEAAAFRSAYEAATGRAFHPHWDVVDAVDVLPYYEGLEAVAGWPGEAWPTEARGRLEVFLEEALADLG